MKRGWFSWFSWFSWFGWGSWPVGAAAALLGLAGAAIAIAPALSGTLRASAAAPAYSVSASGTSLRVVLDGHTLAAGTSSVSAGSGAPVSALAAGEVAPAVVVQQEATANAPGASQSRSQKCAEPTTSFPPPLATSVSSSVACSAASASEDGAGMPTASATAGVASLSLRSASGSGTPATALETLLPGAVTQGSSLATSLGAVLGALPPLPSSGLGVGTGVSQGASRTSGATVTVLVSGTLGPSVSSISTSGGVVTASSEDAGATVELLRGVGAAAGPLLTVHVGRADSVVRAAPATGKVAVDATAAAATVTVDPASGPAQTVSVTPGGSHSFLTGTPLRTTVSIAAPATTTSKGTASAGGVVIDLAQGVGATGADGNSAGVSVVLAASSARATVTTAPVLAAGTVQPTSAGSVGQTAPVTPLSGATTVHTGEPWAGPLPIALLCMTLLAGLGLVARRRLASSLLVARRTTGRVLRGARGATPHTAGPGLRDLLRPPSGSGPGPAVRHAVTLSPDRGGTTGAHVGGLGTEDD